MKLKRVELTYPQEDPHHAVFESVTYARGVGPEMIRFRCREESDDITGSVVLSVSRDHGATWHGGQTWPSGEKLDGGVHREYWIFPLVAGDRLLLMGAKGLLRNDNALDGMTQYTPWYRVSADAGETWAVDEPVVGSSGELDATHPFPDVWIGRNSVMPANTPLLLRDGRVLVPCNVTLLGPDGQYLRPEGAFTYTAAGVLEGRWMSGGRLAWTLFEPVRLAPDQAIRGAIEPTLAELPDGRILMVIRADRGAADSSGGRKWYSVSNDGGRTWTSPARWTYSDGTPFFSPSSISQLFRHSSGDWFWVGNICPDPPQGNGPRYPLVIGRVDPRSLLLDRESIAVIDTRGESDSERLQLSNFSLYEDRRTGDVVLRLTRWDGVVSGGAEPIKASVYAYRFQL